MEKIHLLSLSLQELEAWCQKKGYPAFRGRQIHNWLFQNWVSEFTSMVNLPKALVAELELNAKVRSLEAVNESLSVDGTIKWVFRTGDGYFFESVLLPSEGRRSACVSSQVGCAMGCTFCRTASMGFIRNLTLGEILEQAFHINQSLKSKAAIGADINDWRLTNIIFMGMGEPLHNLEMVASACDVLISAQGFGISKHKITVSTSGILPKIEEWADRCPDIKLAISLNGSNDAMRSELMPVNRRWPIEELLATADAYAKKTGQRLTLEYVLIKEKTCTLEAARELRHLASNLNCKINLIPFNPGQEGETSFPFKTPSENEIEAFEQELNCGGFEVLRRKTRGREIFAACGQLAVKEQKRKSTIHQVTTEVMDVNTEPSGILGR